MKRNMVLIALLGLSACGPAGFGDGAEDTTETEAPAPAPAAPPAEGFEADIVILPDAQTVETMVVPAGLTVTPGEGDIITIAGTSANEISHGVTGGAAFVLGPELENQIGGHVINLRILAKSDGATGFKVAYSTNEVGNSGWNEFSLTDSFEEYAVEFAVGAVKDGRNDYVGFVPVGGDMSIAAVGIDVLRERAAPAPETPAPADDAEE